MANGKDKKLRSSRVARLDLPPNALELALAGLRRGDVLVRLALCLLAAVVVWAATGLGKPPFSFRVGDTPERDIVARASFKVPDPEDTRRKREQAERQSHIVFVNATDQIAAWREELKNKASVLGKAKLLDDDKLALLHEFALPSEAKTLGPQPPEPDDDLNQFHQALTTPDAIEKFKAAIDEALLPIDKHGLLDEPPKDNEGNQKEIRVYRADRTSADTSIYSISDVLTVEALPELQRAVSTKLGDSVLAKHTNAWLTKRLKPTLKLDRAATVAARRKAMDEVPLQFDTIAEGDPLVQSGLPLTRETIEILRREYEAEEAQPHWTERFWRSVAIFGMFAALFSLSGYYMYFRQRALLASLPRFVIMLSVVTLAILAATLAAKHIGDQRVELIPLLLFGMTVAVAYHQEMALLLTAAAAIPVVFLSGHWLADYVLLVVVSASAIALLGRIRSRRKLIYVGLAAGIVAVLTALGVYALAGQPIGLPLWVIAGCCGLWALAAAFLMTGLLPFIEALFGVQTDLSLIELGDVSHPLLQELVRRAPGTYNHSINVASLGEAAAEAIGAHGLLVRVGAYFHDIGKMLKPSYYIENQGQQGNLHEDLVPAMSTLIIIAHVKDGADLARQHHLAKPIVDFIQQHHGTTLVEYFYGRAAKQSDPDAGTLDETDFRYPGPKPQSKEAAVLMLADAAESACRSLVEPAPARIEGLVHDIGMKRLLDGQFDDCGLTLHELATIEDSLVKSLIAVYHGRVKYPDQRTA